MQLYFVSGRICDYEDHFKLVVANSKDDASQKFESFVREFHDVEDSEFYIEHCETLSQMKQHAIKDNKDSVKSIDLHPTNGCITVAGSNEFEGFNTITEALNAHPDIYCDWIDGSVISGN